MYKDDSNFNVNSQGLILDLIILDFHFRSYSIILLRVFFREIKINTILLFFSK